MQALVAPRGTVLDGTAEEQVASDVDVPPFTFAGTGTVGQAEDELLDAGLRIERQAAVRRRDVEVFVAGYQITAIAKDDNSTGGGNRPVPEDGAVVGIDADHPILAGDE